MKTITLNETEFNALLDGVRHTVSSDNARPAMQYIKIVVEKFSITAYSPNGISPTIPTMGGGHQDPKIVVPEAATKGYDIASTGDSINMAFPGSTTRRGRVGHGVAQTLTAGDVQQVVVEPTEDYRFYQQAIETLQENDCEAGDTIDAYNKRVNKDGISPAITTRPDGFKTAILPVVDDSEQNAVWNNDLGCFVDARTGEMLVGDYERPEPQKPNYRIRKLTPRECFRLMGVKKRRLRKSGEASIGVEPIPPCGR